MMILTTAIIIIPVVPLLIYLVGLLIPASHIVSRSSSLKISAKNLWLILTDISKYPEWQHKIQDIVIDEIDINKAKVVFVEYSTRKTLVIHHERIPFRSLIRILEENPSSAISDKYQFNKKAPTFSGSWTFDIIPQDDQVTLKITEQGVIKNPLARITHLVFYRYHYRIDQFLKDLQSLVNKQNQKTLNSTSRIEATNDVILDQQLEPNDTVSNSDKEWDLVSEIYEKPM